VRLTQTYGIDPAEYTMILHEQDFRCAICRRQPRYNLDVDHDHKSGAVRGLLCKLCNRRLLPSVKDDVALLWSAVRYLEDPPADRALGRRVIVPGSIA
jgi:hypothetical protein